MAGWKGIVSRFKGKLTKMIKDVNCRFDDYSISPKLCGIGAMNYLKVTSYDLGFFLFI